MINLIFFGSIILKKESQDRLNVIDGTAKVDNTQYIHKSFMFETGARYIFYRGI